MQKHQQVQQFEQQLCRLQQLLQQCASSGQWAAMRRCDQQLNQLVARISYLGLKTELANPLATLKAYYTQLLQHLEQEQAALGQLLQETQQQTQAVSAYQFTMDATAK